MAAATNDDNKTEIGLQGEMIDPCKYLTIPIWNREATSRLFCGLSLSSTANGNLDYLCENGSNEDFNSQVLPDELTVSEKMACSMCNVTFSSRADQSLHFKLDWHCENLRRKREGEDPLVRELYEIGEEDGRGNDADKVEGDDEGGESGSSSEDNDTADVVKPIDSSIETLRRQFNWHSKLFFENVRGEVLAFHKCLVLNNKETAPTSTAIVKRTLQMSNHGKWAVLLLGSGHFAAAIYNENEVVVHKTIHRYVTRAKQGKAQGLHDNHSKHAKSAGANLRRYNEAALIENIQELLGSWSHELDSCHLIFYKVSARSKSSLFGGKDPPLKRNDNRLRVVPFQTRKPTYKETTAVWRRLSTLEYFGDKVSWLDRIPHRLQSRSTNSEVAFQVKERKLKQSHLRDGDSTTNRVPASSAGDKQLLKIKKSRQESPHHDRTSDSDSPDDDGELILSYEESLISMSHLEPFGGINLTPKEHRENNKKAKKSNKNVDTVRKMAPTDNSVLDKREERLRDLLYTACCLNDLEKIKSLLGLGEDSDHHVDRYDDLSADRIKLVLNSKFGRERKSLLHVVSKSGFKQILLILLDRGADPSIPNGKGHLPYTMATDKETRNTFRRFRADFPDKYDYETAQVPGALSSEMETLRIEKRRQQRKLKQTRDNEKKLELREKTDFLSLSETQKVNVVVQQSVKLRCFQCGDLLTKTPFEYLSYKFCSVNCVKLHRQDKKN